MSIGLILFLLDFIQKQAAVIQLLSSIINVYNRELDEMEADFQEIERLVAEMEKDLPEI